MLESGIISEIALIFVTDDDFDSQLNRALAIVGAMLDVSRCYLFVDSDDGTTTSNTHEWCAEGIEPQLHTMQAVPYAVVPSWKKILEDETVHAVEDITSMPEDIRLLLEPQGVRAFVAAPLRIENAVRGFLGFDECNRVRAWSNTEIETLKTVVGVISTAYSKKLLAERMLVSEENFRNFFDTLDDIIFVADMDGRILFASEGTIRKLDYTLDELTAKNIIDLYPPDKQDEARQILEAMFRGERAYCPIELWTHSKTRIPVETRIWFSQWNGRNCVFGVSKDLSAEQFALQKFERLFRNNPAAMAVSSIDDQLFVDVNKAFLDKLGFTRDEVVGHSSQELQIFLDDEHWSRVKDALLDDGRIGTHELTVRRKDGELIHGLLSGDTIDTQGQRFALTVMVDITPQIRLQAELEREHDRLMNIIEGTRLGTWEWNVQTGETIFNERWAEMAGYSLAELGPTTINTWMNLAHPEDLVESERLLNLHFEGVTDFYECESRMRHKNGCWIWVSDRGKVIERDEQGRPFKMYGTHSDITEKKAMEEQIHDLAIRDPLTQIYNRRHIFERLEGIVAEYLRRGRNFCISILDIDNFKKVNDTYGHQAGDFVLREFASVISSNIRQYDLLGRYGGEEFIIISPNAGGTETSILIERIMGLVRGKDFVFGGQSIRFTFSCGLADSAEFSWKDFSIETMISAADKRLYLAKDGGKDHCVGPDAVERCRAHDG